MKDLRHMSRGDLIEIIYEMKKNEEQLTAELEECRNKVPEVSEVITAEEPGSIASEALRINKVFEAAQAAADRYLVELKSKYQDTESYCDNLRAKVEEECAAKTAQTDAECQVKVAEADAVISEKWELFQTKAYELIASHQELAAMLKI